MHKIYKSLTGAISAPVFNFLSIRFFHAIRQKPSKLPKTPFPCTAPRAFQYSIRKEEDATASSSFLISAIQILLSLCFKKCFDCFMCHIDIGLGDNLIRRMHGDHRNTEINHINIFFRDKFSNRTAAAAVDLAKL